jgi:predicted SnoaL-like aldol condensation-catalyzing enzyme
MASKRGNPNFGKSKNDNSEVENNTQETKIVESKPIWKPDLTRMICVKNIARGRLVYKSKRQLGYTVIWENRGSTNYMELGEFINLKNSDLRFVQEPWIRIIEDDEVEILKYANVYQYYKEMIEVNDVETLLNYDFDKFVRKFDKLPEGYKNTVAEYAAQMIQEGKLDSIKIKNHIEKSMNIDLSFLIQKDTKKKPDVITIK